MSKKLLAVMLSVIMAVALLAVPATSAGLLDIFSNVTAANSSSQEGESTTAANVDANVVSDSTNA